MPKYGYMYDMQFVWQSKPVAIHLYSIKIDYFNLGYE
jgi:hypothetical protein